jgi:Tfp pilus assembly protein PilF
MLHYESGELAQAQQYCRQVLAREPNHVAGLTLLGTIARETGRNNAAFRLYAKALAADPRNPRSHYNLALAYEALGNRDEAVRHFTSAIALGFDNPATLAKRSPAIAACLSHLAKTSLRLTNNSLE